MQQRDGNRLSEEVFGLALQKAQEVYLNNTRSQKGRVRYHFPWVRDTGQVWLRGLARRLFFDSLLVSLN